jgi:DNA-binding NarL/FixJ family response regulator
VNPTALPRGLHGTTAGQARVGAVAVRIPAAGKGSQITQGLALSRQQAFPEGNTRERGQPVTTLATTITVALGATDPLRLAGLSRLLEADPAFDVAGRDDAAASVLVFAADRVDKRVVPVLRRSSVETRRPVVLVVDDITRDELLLAIECRVVGVLPVGAVTGDRLADSVRAAIGGGAFLPPGLTGQILDHLRGLQSRILEESGLNASGLTPREVSVISLMAEGLETTEIGARLHCSDRTIKSVVSGITRRLGLRNRSHIIAHAMRFGVI